MNRFLAISKNTVRLLLGALFIASAVMKLLSIDTFQIYVFSFNILSFALTEIAVRLLIGVELVIGALLILKLHYRWVWWLATLMTAGFTLFLVYVVLFRHDSNCHCFGDIIEVEPAMSIIKNLIIIGLLIFSRNIGDRHWRFEKKMTEETGRCRWKLIFSEVPFRSVYRYICYAVVGVGSFVASFVLFPPNAIYSRIFSRNNLVSTPIFERAYADSSFYIKLSNIQYDTKKDTVTFDIDTARLGADKGTYIVAVVSAGCKYCKQSCELMGSIFSQNQLPTDRFKLLIWSNNYPQCAHFIRTTKTQSFDFHRISPFLACDMVYGAFPTFIQMKNGKVVGAFDYRGITEKKVVEFIRED